MPGWWQVFSSLLGALGAWWWRFLFSGESKSRTWFCACGGLMKQRLLRSCGWLVMRVLQGKYCLCFGFDGLFLFVACCWVSRATLVVL